MLVDKILYKGTRIYAIQYMEPGVQKEASNYYPVSKNVLAIAEKDPNLLDAIRQDMLARRTQIELSLSATLTPELAAIIEQGKKDITATMEKSTSDLAAQMIKDAAAKKKADDAAAQAAEKNTGGTNQ